MINKLFSYNIDYNLSKDIDIVQYNILPIKQYDLYILVATSDINQDPKPIIKLLNSPIKFIYIQKIYLEYEYKYIKTKIKLYQLALQALDDDITTQTNSYTTQFLNIILQLCIQNNISDIHFESLKNDLLIRLRFDGVLNQFFKFDKKLYSMISSIIKFLAHLDISQKRLPLNGRFGKQIDGDEFDFRISTMPTIYGESIVLRILNNKNIQKNLDSIGFGKSDLNKIYKNLSLTQGLILVTGPTGSGKTTTLYSMLNHLNQSSKKIITIEDPVEYKLDGIMQVNLNPQIELDYYTVLKNILRQDPDILLIGEIRDTLSAKIAIRAALTGHLVIATLHTNNSIETITRLIDLKIEPYLISSTLKMIIAQRLVRKLCNDCKQYDNQTKLYIPKGCAKCNLMGYINRTVVAEILEIDKDIASKISQNQKIKIDNFRSLSTVAQELLDQGIISKEEFLSKIDYDI